MAIEIHGFSLICMDLHDITLKCNKFNSEVSPEDIITLSAEKLCLKVSATFFSNLKMLGSYVDKAYTICLGFFRVKS